MPYTLKNLSGFPLDVPTLSGPVILPAYGEVIAELGGFDAEVMRQSPYVEVSEGGKVKAIEHTKETDDDKLATLRSEYQDLYGKRAYHGWSAEELQEKIDAKLAE
ncbi:hypothetical protein [Agrobacterium pusense]|uniref:hypothetical protein n=1 Tax=Agrobacterium pusense TaxID=648995 RepID=UPI000D1A3CBE|nr:hypothetical protein [Agrobacterium pusense]